MLSGISRKRSIRSNPYWFTEFCNSQCLSHFAAPFIVVRAETSVAESCVHNIAPRSQRPGLARRPEVIPAMVDFKRKPKTWPQGSAKETARDATQTAALERLWHGNEAHTPRSSPQEIHSYLDWMRANDPSAGSPTETLLRLLLPLSDKVH